MIHQNIYIDRTLHRGRGGVHNKADEKRGYRCFAPGALHPKTEVEEGVMCEECTRLMTDFFKKKRA